MIESQNVNHMKGKCSWNIFLWKKSSVLQSFVSFQIYFNFLPMLQ